MIRIENFGTKYWGRIFFTSAKLQNGKIEILVFGSLFHFSLKNAENILTQEKM